MKEFDILAFSVYFEQDNLNILEMLCLSGIAADKRERTEDDPLLVLGGICSFFNPEPLADFFDVVIVGEGEEAIGEFIDAYKADRSKDRQELLRSLAAIPGVYIPGFYGVAYHEDGTIKERKKLEPVAPAVIKKRVIEDINSAPAASVILTPNTEYSDRYLAEITRGCGRHCRFCMAGYIYLPPRNLGIEPAKELAAKADRLCGKIGLVGAALSDYPGINDLCSAVKGGVSVSSLRADSISGELVARLAKSGHRTISIAPEAGSERLRRVMAHQAVHRVAKAITQHKTRVIDLDLRAYFDNVRHHILLEKVSKRVSDKDVLWLPKMMLKATGKNGVPQGGVISPLLSNLYLNEVDRMLERAKEVTRRGEITRLEYARFADDLVVLVSSRSDCDWLFGAVEKRLREELAKLQVEVNEEKSRKIDLAKDEIFGFLGFDFRRVLSHKGAWRPNLTPKMKKRTELLH